MVVIIWLCIYVCCNKVLAQEANFPRLKCQWRWLFECAFPTIYESSLNNLEHSRPINMALPVVHFNSIWWNIDHWNGWHLLRCISWSRNQKAWHVERNLGMKDMSSVPLSGTKETKRIWWVFLTIVKHRHTLWLDVIFSETLQCFERRSWQFNLRRNFCAFIPLKRKMTTTTLQCYFLFHCKQFCQVNSPNALIHPLWLLCSSM